MHFFADFDNQTKLMHVGYSVLGALISLVILVKFKPTIVPRLIASVLLSFALIYCLAAPQNGDHERLKNIYSVGWFVLGLLFGIGRGEYIIAYLTLKLFPPEKAAENQAAAVEDAAVEKDSNKA